MVETVIGRAHPQVGTRLSSCSVDMIAGDCSLPLGDAPIPESQSRKMDKRSSFFKLNSVVVEGVDLGALCGGQGGHPGIEILQDGQAMIARGLDVRTLPGGEIEYHPATVLPGVGDVQSASADDRKIERRQA